MIEQFAFCPRCGQPMTDRPGKDGATIRRACSDQACRFVQRRNPTPAVGALVEHEGDIVLARNVQFPEGWFALVTGYLEAGEEPKAAVAREVREELGLDSISMTPIGNYIFEKKNEVMLCYHVVTQGTITLGPELAEYRRYRPEELKPWPRATGLAVADWMTGRGLAFEFADFPGAEDWLRKQNG
jgi:NADH pyrophosphatase NudC (nudix superfamily)